MATNCEKWEIPLYFINESESVLMDQLIFKVGRRALLVTVVDANTRQQVMDMSPLTGSAMVSQPPKEMYVLAAASFKEGSYDEGQNALTSQIPIYQTVLQVVQLPLAIYGFW